MHGFKVALLLSVRSRVSLPPGCQQLLTLSHPLTSVLVARTFSASLGMEEAPCPAASSASEVVSQNACLSAENESLLPQRFLLRYLCDQLPRVQSQRVRCRLERLLPRTLSADAFEEDDLSSLVARKLACLTSSLRSFRCKQFSQRCKWYGTRKARASWSMSLRASWELHDIVSRCFAVLCGSCALTPSKGVTLA